MSMFIRLDAYSVARSRTVVSENEQCGLDSSALAILLSADYKEVALSAPTGTSRARVATLEDVECKTSRKITPPRFMIQPRCLPD
jgi:hypothetical protein